MAFEKIINFPTDEITLSKTVLFCGLKIPWLYYYDPQKKSTKINASSVAMDLDFSASKCVKSNTNIKCCSYFDKYESEKKRQRNEQTFHYNIAQIKKKKHSKKHSSNFKVKWMQKWRFKKEWTIPLIKVFPRKNVCFVDEPTPWSYDQKNSKNRTKYHFSGCSDGFRLFSFQVCS